MSATHLVVRLYHPAMPIPEVASFFNVAFDPDPRPTDPTTVERARFEEALDVLAASGVPLVVDRDQAWRDFNGWRVNYDAPLRALERLTMAPAA